MPDLRKTSLLSAAAAVGLLALFAGGCQKQDQSAAAGPTSAAKPAAPGGADVASLDSFKTGAFKQLDFSSKLDLPKSAFIDGSGSPHTLAEYKGKVVVVNIWGEWCAPCVKEMPTLAQLQKAFPNGDVAVVPVAFGYPQDQAKAQAKLKTLAGDALPFFYDSTYNVSYDLKSGIFPSTIIFNKDGKEAARLEKDADWSTPEAVGLVKSIAAGKG